MFNQIDYKGKYFIIQDKDFPDEWGMDFVIGEISKKDALNKQFIKLHTEECMYYGIPCYLGSDKDLRKAYPH